MPKRHKHDFVNCGYDEQQCDNECRSNSHKCSVCGKSRSQIAKKPTEVRRYVAAETKKIVQELHKVGKAVTLEEAVGVLKTCSQKLDWLWMDRLVDLARCEENKL